jgi:hypothetical protein
MGIRELLNGKLGPGIGAALILVALAVLGFQVLGSKENAAGSAVPSKAFYSDDNGKTFFKDDARKIAPFDHNGRQAFRVDVFKCPDGKQFVGLIYRYTDGGRREMEAFLAQKVNDPDGVMRQGIEQRGMQVKLVGADEKAWVLNDEMTQQRLQMAVKCPGGGGAAQLVTP